MTGTSAWELLELTEAELQNRAGSTGSAADAGAALRVLAGLVENPTGLRDPGDAAAAADLTRAVTITTAMTDRLGRPGRRAEELAGLAADVVRTSPLPTAGQRRALVGKVAATATAAVNAIALADERDLVLLGPGRLGLPGAVEWLRTAVAALPDEPPYGALAAAWLRRPIPRPMDPSGTVGAASAVRALAGSLREATEHRSVTAADLKQAVLAALQLLSTARSTADVAGGASEQALAAGRAWRSIGAALHVTVDGAQMDAAIRQAAADVGAELPVMDSAGFALAARELPDLAAAVNAALAEHARGYRRSPHSDRAERGLMAVPALALAARELPDLAAAVNAALAQHDLDSRPQPGDIGSDLLMLRTPMSKEEWGLMKLVDRKLTDQDRPLVPMSSADRAALAAAGVTTAVASHELRDHLNQPEIVGLERALMATATPAVDPQWHDVPLPTNQIDGPRR